MIDQSIILGGGTAMAGVVAGVGLVAFAESMWDRSAERGIGLSENMSTRITGGLMEDVEVDSVEDLSSLTDKLEAALMKSGGADQEALHRKQMMDGDEPSSINDETWPYQRKSDRSKVHARFLIGISRKMGQNLSD